GPPVPDQIPPKEDAKTRAELLGRAFAEAWPVQKWPLTFIHFREVDDAGHRKGWMGPEYIDGVQAVDRALGTILATIEKNGGLQRTANIMSAYPRRNRRSTSTL